MRHPRRPGQHVDHANARDRAVARKAARRLKRIDSKTQRTLDALGALVNA